MENDSHQWMHGSGILVTCSNCDWRTVKEGLLYCAFDPPRNGEQESCKRN